MRSLSFGFFVFGLLLSHGSFAETVRTKHVTAELVAENQTLQAGAAANRVGVRLEMVPEWHTYWRFPGDSGLPTEIRWDLPKGWKAGDIEWPLPERIMVPPLVNYGYSGEALLGIPLEIPPKASGEFDLTAHVSWLVCREECIPEKVDLHLRVLVNRAPGKAGALAAEFRKLSQEQTASDPPETKVTMRGNELGIRLGIPFAHDRVFDLLPLAPLILKGDKAPRVEWDGEHPVLWLERADPYDGKATELPAELVVRGPAGGPPRVLELKATLPPVASALPADAATAAPVEPVSTESPWMLVLLALLGGLVLNLMPCVFPVLGIKVMSLVRQSAGEKSHARVHGQAYAAGVVVSFWVLAASLVALRAAGKSVGWGFQLQDPSFVTILILLFTFVTADLAGFIHWSGRWMGAGSGLAEKEGLTGSFFTGVLAVVVATPCTAPFMGTAIGAAIGEPAWVVFFVFTALGLGLAMPFLVLCYFPSYLKVLPKPGAWMERMKELFAFPIAATVLWLLWVLTLQIGSEGALKVETGLLVLMGSVWVRRRFEGGGARAMSHLVLAVGVFLCAMGAHSPPPQGGGTMAGGAWKPYTEAAVSEALSAGKPVFIDFTAAWCLTCQVNRKLVLDRAGVQNYFKEKGVQLFLADWTNRDPAITKALEHQGRIGVPLYLAYHAGDSHAVVLPQLLSEDRIRAFFP